MSNRALSECDVQLYRQMGCLRDDLALHERALDILVELLKKEQVVILLLCMQVEFYSYTVCVSLLLSLAQLDESVPLNGVEKAINHFEVLNSAITSVHCTRGKKFSVKIEYN